jgi:hypothetical protein
MLTLRLSKVALPNQLTRASLSAFLSVKPSRKQPKRSNCGVPITSGQQLVVQPDGLVELLMNLAPLRSMMFPARLSNDVHLP